MTPHQSALNYEAALGRIADKALSARRGVPIRNGRPVIARTNYWPRIVEAMRSEWMTSDVIALKSGLRTSQVLSQFKQHGKRRQVELRGSRRNGYEWRLKPGRVG